MCHSLHKDIKFKPNFKEEINPIKEQIDVYKASLSSLSTNTSNIDRTMSVEYGTEKIIAINRVTEQTKQFCNMLPEMNSNYFYIRNIREDTQGGVTLP